MTVWGRRALKILFHLVALAGLCLAFLFSLFLGLQVRPLYGSIGFAVTVVLAGLYFGILRRSRRTKLGKTTGRT